MFLFFGFVFLKVTLADVWIDPLGSQESRQEPLQLCKTGMGAWTLDGVGEGLILATEGTHFANELDNMREDGREIQEERKGQGSPTGPVVSVLGPSPPASRALPLTHGGALQPFARPSLSSAAQPGAARACSWGPL